eukprot:1224421-Pleurochrysis_carterae.AAC.1
MPARRARLPTRRSGAAAGRRGQHTHSGAHARHFKETRSTGREERRQSRICTELGGYATLMKRRSGTEREKDTRVKQARKERGRMGERSGRESGWGERVGRVGE